MIFLLLLSTALGRMTRHYSSKLLLISLDGFRWDYLHRNLTLDNFHAFAADGVHAKWMTNQFQTKTFPNHWTMVTGLYEESHGIVANKFWDHSGSFFGDFFSKIRISTEKRSHLKHFLGHHFNYVNASSWKDWPEFWGGEPLWITNQRQGGSSGCEFWVGSEVNGRTPTYFDKYDSHKEKRFLVDLKVDLKILGWAMCADL